jgi:hypothetical protein
MKFKSNNKRSAIQSALAGDFCATETSSELRGDAGKMRRLMGLLRQRGERESVFICSSQRGSHTVWSVSSRRGKELGTNLLSKNAVTARRRKKEWRWSVQTLRCRKRVRCWKPWNEEWVNVTYCLRGGPCKSKKSLYWTKRKKCFFFGTKHEEDNALEPTNGIKELISRNRLNMTASNENISFKINDSWGF